jgi:hypothetical protein
VRQLRAAALPLLACVLKSKGKPLLFANFVLFLLLYRHGQGRDVYMVLIDCHQQSRDVCLGNALPLTGLAFFATYDGGCNTWHDETDLYASNLVKHRLLLYRSYGFE